MTGGRAVTLVEVSETEGGGIPGFCISPGSLPGGGGAAVMLALVTTI